MAKIVTAAAIKAQIVALQAKLVEVEAAESLTKICVAVGDPLTFNFGRGEKRRLALQGVVKGIAESEKGTKYRVEVGEGFDVESFVIGLSDIVVGDLFKVDAAIEKEAEQGASADPLSMIS